jgi:hypothetical protein
VPAAADYVWCVEDDVEPPANALECMALDLFRYKDVGAVSGVLRSRFADRVMLWKDGKELAVKPDSLMDIDASGFYCALFRREVFDSLAFRPTRDWTDRHCAYDWAAWYDLKLGGWKARVNTNVGCKHWMEDGRWI